MSARQVLFLAHRIPYPPDKGDKIRSFRLFERLCRRFDLHLGCFVDNAADFAYTDVLARRAASAAFVPLRPVAAKLRAAGAVLSSEPLSLAYYRHPAMRAFVAKARARGLAAEVVISSAMAQYVAEPSGAPRIVDFCDSDAEKWRAYAQGASGPMRALYALEARRLAAAETAIANWADAAFAASEAEAAIFNAREGIVRKVLWFGNGVETDEFSPRKDYPRPADAGEVVFVGVMDYRPNVEGVLWFTDDVWPRVRLDAPGARFAIVGARPVRRVRALAGRDGVNVTGAVADVRPFLTHARVAVAPLAIARGVANKVIEAMAMGLPVVMTEAANCGVGARVGEAVVATGAEAFAEAVAGLLRDPVRAQAIGAAARARMTADFSWERRLAPFEEAVERAASE